MRLLDCLIVGLGGFIGSVFRYMLGKIPITMGDFSDFPIMTLVINIIGAFVIGIAIQLANESKIEPQFVLFLKVGLCGGFTTFSSFAAENISLLSNGKFLLAIVYVILTVLVGFLAVIVGQKVVIAFH